jgi:hypothetical protein
MKHKAGGCVDRNAKGEPCGMPRLEDSDRCFAHDPTRGAARARARKRGGRNRRVASVSEAPTDASPLREVGAIQGQLEAALFNTLQLENSNGRSRTIGYLLGFALKALEVGELEARLAALEQQIANPTLRRTA